MPLDPKLKAMAELIGADPIRAFPTTILNLTTSIDALTSSIQAALMILGPQSLGGNGNERRNTEH